MNLGKILSCFSNERELRTVWKVEKDGKSGFLAGSAHFSPHSFKKSLRVFVNGVRVVCFEGPLDEGSMGQVVQQGLEPGGAVAVYEALSPETRQKIKYHLREIFMAADPFSMIFANSGKGQNPLRHHFQSLRPWIAFFSLWSAYLKQKGWVYSVDLEALEISRKLGKEVVFLETIEEQVAGMEGIPNDRIVAFLERIDEWGKWARMSARLYLTGDLEPALCVTENFPSRCPSIVENRDPIFFERMKGFFEKGGAMAFVGTSHIPGLQRRFQAAGFRLTQVAGAER
jgi:uncharacterized protein YbaP (TraB family)